MNWFELHRFYLQKEMCDELNIRKNEFYSKYKHKMGTMIILYQDFIPNPDMNETFFISDKE